MQAPVRSDAVLAAVRAAPAPAQGLEAAFAADYRVLDGRFAGNAWLQELPTPSPRSRWDNAAFLSPATARRLGLENGRRVSLALRGRTVEAPVWIVPGHADDCVTLPLGYGRTVEGPIGRGRRLRRLPVAPRRRAVVRRRPLPARRRRGRMPSPPPRATSPWRGARSRSTSPPPSGRSRARRARRAARRPRHHPGAGRLLEAGLQVGDGDRPLPLHRAAAPASSPARRRTTSPVVGKEQVAKGRDHALDPHRPVLRRHARGARGASSQPRRLRRTARPRPASTSAR